MAPARRRRRGQRRRQSRPSPGSRGSYEEVFTFSVEAGATAQITVAQLTGRPPRCSFRPRHMSCEFATYVPAATPTFTPVAFQFGFGYGGNNEQEVVISPCRLASTNVQRQGISMPITQDWYAWNVDKNAQIGWLTAICLGATKPSAYVRGVVRLRLDLQIEDLAGACPSQHLEGHRGDEDGNTSAPSDLRAVPSCSMRTLGDCSDLLGTDVEVVDLPLEVSANADVTP